MEIINKSDAKYNGQRLTSEQKHVITWNDIIGFEKEKAILYQRFVDHFKYRDEMRGLNITPSKGMILAGIPGVGKTLLVKTTINEIFEKNKRYIKCNVISHHEFMDGNIGKSSEKIANIFEAIRKDAQKYDREQVLIIDEIDVLCHNRGRTKSILTKERTTAFLTQLDGIYDKDQDISVFILGTTNRPGDLDPAIIRAGRLDYVCRIYPPDAEDRLKLFEYYFKHVNIGDNKTINIDNRHCLIKAAQMSSGLTGADIASLARDMYTRGKDHVITEQELIDYIRDDYETFQMRENLIRNFEKAMEKFGFGTSEYNVENQ